MTTGIRSDEAQGATFVELFFDLVFVFAVTQVTSWFAHHMTLSGLLSVVVVFWLVWWAWTQFTWSLNEADTEHPIVRLLVLVATAVAFFMALAVPVVAESGGWMFSLAYLVVRVVGISMQWQLAASDDAWTSAVRRWTLTSSLGLIAVAVSIFVPDQHRISVLAVAAVLDIVAAARSGAGEWQLFASHFAERHGLIVIIALGESLIVAGATVSNAGVPAGSIGLAGSAVVITCALWWTYFADAHAAMEDGMARASGRDLGRFARDVYSFGHVPVIAGVVSLAAGLELALGHPDEPMGVASVALSVGAAMFVGGVGVALVRADARVTSWRWVTVGALAVCAPALTGARPSVALPIVAALVVTGAWAVHRSPGHRAPVPTD